MRARLDLKCGTVTEMKPPILTTCRKNKFWFMNLIEKRNEESASLCA